jgi:hypothetical protein
MPYSRDFDPNLVKRTLGRLTLIGRSIEYLDRIVVTSGSSETVDKSGPILFSNNVAVVKGKTAKVSLSGLHLAGAGITSSVDGLVKNVTVNDSGTTVTFDLDATKVAAAGSVAALLTTRYGASPITINISADGDAAKPAGGAANGAPAAETPASKDGSSPASPNPSAEKPGPNPQ